MDTFNELYAEFKKEFPSDHLMMCFKEERVVKEQFEEKVERFIKHLVKLGIGRGSIVGYSLPNSTDIIPLFTAIGSIGACTVPLFPMIPDRAKVDTYQKLNIDLAIVTSKALEGFINASEAAGSHYQVATIDFNEGKVPSFSEEIEVDLTGKCLEETPSDLPLMIASSSGTTGIPKFVKLTQGNVGSELKVSKQLCNYKVNPKDLEGKNDIAAVAFPLSTSVMVVLYGMMIKGSALAFSDDTSALGYLRLIDKWQCDTMSNPPAYYEAILQVIDQFEGDLSSVIKVTSGMDFCPPALIKRLKGSFPNLKYFSNGYGLIETCNVYMIGTIDIRADEFGPTNCLDLASAANNQFDIRDAEGNSVLVGEEGELYVRGDNVIKGYEDNEEGNQISFKDGWFRSGDIARKESETSITLLGRKKYFIKRGGKSISPIVVQNYINQVKGVQETGVVGVPHPLYGEMLWAFVVRKPDSNVSLREIKKYCREYLPFYMLPDQISFIEALPRNAGVGKMSFEKLKELAKQELLSMGGN